MDAPALATAAGAAFATGLLGGLHCAGMCGGIVAALSVPSRAPAPGVATAVRINFVPARSGPGSRHWPIALAFNGGRIATYALAGSVAGAAGSLLLFADGTLPVQRIMYAAANLMLAALGLYLLGVTRFLRGFERAGAGLWRRLRPCCVICCQPTQCRVRQASGRYGVGCRAGWSTACSPSPC